VHYNFEPANVLLDKKFLVCVDECGLVELMAPSSVTQVSYDIVFYVFRVTKNGDDAIMVLFTYFLSCPDYLNCSHYYD
jgi:hypothetical protein